MSYTVQYDVYICASGFNFSSFSVIFHLDCETVPTVWYLFVFHFIVSFT